MSTSSPTLQESGRRSEHIIDDSLAGLRIDQVLTVLHPGLSRAAANDIISKRLVQVDGRFVKPATRAVSGALLIVEFPAPEPIRAEAEQIDLNVVYEDDALIVIDKPAGMVVHPAPGNQHGTLVNALLGHYAHQAGDPFWHGPNLSEAEGFHQRPGIVHRLDKDTSGLIIVARSAEALAVMAAAFKRRDVRKEYLALLIGEMRPPEGMINAPIGRHPRFRQRMAVVAGGGRPACTKYCTEERLHGYSLVRVLPETGRMHQIRVHFSAAGHPIVADQVYGRPSPHLPLNRQFLHATRLRFQHPVTNKEVELHSPLPSDLQQVLDLLRNT